jgi:hypothetical protein
MAANASLRSPCRPAATEALRTGPTGALVLFENTSVPEPSTGMLFAGAAALWIGWRRKKV